MSAAQFDYIIVGGGTAGSVLATRLSESGDHSVLLLEAGPHYRGLAIKVPGALADLYRAGRYHWPYRSAFEPFAGDQELPYKLGRILGGSSAINGMVWVRGNPRDYDDWSSMGCRGWSYADLEPVFRRIEAFEDPHGTLDPVMGQAGPIAVQRGEPDRNPLNQAFLAAGAEAGYSFNENYNGRHQDGFCILQQNKRRGRRVDAYEGYLKAARQRPNLAIRCGAKARKLSLEGDRCRGVEFHWRGARHKACAKREVILAAGALASPQLLELSGIGDPAVLAAQGLGLRHALKGVGANLHSHPTISCAYECLQPVSLFGAMGPLARLWAGIRWLFTQDGPAASTHFEVGAFLRSRADLDRPDFELTFLALALEDMASSRQGHGFQIYCELIGCKSRGESHIQSPDPDLPPRFFMNYLQDPRDVEALKSALAVMRDLVDQPAFAPYRGAELRPGPAVQSEPEIETWLRQGVGVSHHLVGSCRMGPADDPKSVVGPDLKLCGLRGLRIADASVMPQVPSANTQAATLVIAEKAGDMILADKAFARP